MITFKQVVDLVVADNNANGRTEIAERDVAAIVKKTIESVNLQVDSRTGEVVDARPVPNPYDEVNKQQNVHWSGGRRRRGGVR